MQVLCSGPQSGSLNKPYRYGVMGLLMWGSVWGAQIELSRCDLTANEGRQEVTARCGGLAVPLDRERPDGEQIELRVAVVDALAEQAEPDPLFVIAGGPGDAATGFFAATGGAFSRILRRRDIVLVDQRGSGASAPLNCDALEEDRIGHHVDLEIVVEAAVECLGQLDHDPRYFTTSIAVRDLDDVREALGYERVNLYGISYGTRVAQHYLRRYPERTRSVILDGVLSPDIALGPDVALVSQEGLDALFERCREDEECDDAYPDLPTRFDAVLDRLGDAPVGVTIDHPRTGEPTETTIDRFTLIAIVRLLIYSPRTASVLPALVESAYEGDYRPLATHAMFVAQSVENLAAGLNYAVACTEDAPYVEDVDVDALAATYMGTTFVDALNRVCERWPVGIMDEDLREPVETDVPVLLLSGELDPITPPRYASAAAARMTNTIDIVGRGQGHGMLTVACAQGLMAKFVDRPEAEELDLGCVDRIRPFPLFTSPMGPAP